MIILSVTIAIHLNFKILLSIKVTEEIVVFNISQINILLLTRFIASFTTLHIVHINIHNCLMIFMFIKGTYVYSTLFSYSLFSFFK